MERGKVARGRGGWGNLEEAMLCYFNLASAKWRMKGVDKLLRWYVCEHVYECVCVCL